MHTEGVSLQGKKMAGRHRLEVGPSVRTRDTATGSGGVEVPADLGLGQAEAAHGGGGSG